MQSAAYGATRKAPDEKFCWECGGVIRRRAEICPLCGVRQPGSFGLGLGAVSPSGKNRVAAALFAIFLESFGAHKFYLGQVGRGVLYLIFCWTLIPSILAFIEFILLLAMTDEEFAAKYG